ncbi:probable receptor-like serine/threonine-protein kinase At4g34500 [Selaginella moellendorffii]|nr:probable receptor-like serine/threonine-protein kinase At4g34500 [Selaginella moellendorffii]|eukprot:XP_002967666.2 probable receptor-like serine/threonine-protein kinase At4g34500 [Selaginella moellendorffii]
MEGTLSSELSRGTFVFGLHLWVLICIGVGAIILLILLALIIWLTSRSSSGSHNSYEKFSCCSSSQSLPTTIQQQRKSSGIPIVTKEIQEVVIVPPYALHHSPYHKGAPLDKVARSIPGDDAPPKSTPTRSSSGSSSNRSAFYGEQPPPQPQPQPKEMVQLGWGRWYSLKELDLATNGFCEDSKIGEGGYGVVFKGFLPDGSVVAVKNLLNNTGQAEKEFRVEVEAIGKVRHKNLVRLLGYCAESCYRMLVYEYVDNGNLEDWLHGFSSQTQAFPWEARMKIALGTAKALTYLHEALEPKVVHRDIKASNILVEGDWNAKISDFGLAKLLGSEKSHVTTRVMGTFGYVAPEYASTGLLNERSDVYSFGVLLMELITGRDPVDYSRPPGEVNLVDWLKVMVANRHSEDVADPRLQVKPTPRILKKALLVAIRCVDPDSLRRPKMGHVVHMLEADELPYRQEKAQSEKRSTFGNSPHHHQAPTKPAPLSRRADGKENEVNGGDKHAIYKQNWKKYEV